MRDSFVLIAYTIEANAHIQAKIAASAEPLLLALAKDIFRRGITSNTTSSQKKNEKSYQVQSFCDEKGLAPSLGVDWYAESENQCWQAEK